MHARGGLARNKWKVVGEEGGGGHLMLYGSTSRPPPSASSLASGPDPSKQRASKCKDLENPVLYIWDSFTVTAPVISQTNNESDKSGIFNYTTMITVKREALQQSNQIHCKKI